MVQPRVEVTLDGEPALVLARERPAIELATDLGLSRDEVLVLIRGEVLRWIAPDESISPAAGWNLLRTERLVYVPNEKHKRVPSIGVKGTFCPDVDARRLLDQSYQVASRPRRRWAVLDGCAFEGKSDNAGGWHGYPVKYRFVPAVVWRLWVVDGKSTSADLASDTLWEG